MEDPALFEWRLAEAKKARDGAEEQLRLFFYIDSLALVEVLHTYNYTAALHRAALQVRVWLIGDMEFEISYTLVVLLGTVDTRTQV